VPESCFQRRQQARCDGSAIVFLRLNGIEPAPDSDAWEALVLDVAASKLDREQTTARLRRLTASRRKPRARKKKPG